LPQLITKPHPREAVLGAMNQKKLPHSVKDAIKQEKMVSPKVRVVPVTGLLKIKLFVEE
jgi:hypothetical protein